MLQNLQSSLPKAVLAMISHSGMDRAMQQLCSSILVRALPLEILDGPGFRRLPFTSPPWPRPVRPASTPLVVLTLILPVLGILNLLMQLGKSEPPPAVSPACCGVLTTRRKGKARKVRRVRPSHGPESG